MRLMKIKSIGRCQAMIRSVLYWSLDANRIYDTRMATRFSCKAARFLDRTQRTKEIGPNTEREGRVVLWQRREQEI